MKICMTGDDGENRGETEKVRCVCLVADAWNDEVDRIQEFAGNLLEFAARALIREDVSSHQGDDTSRSGMTLQCRPVRPVTRILQGARQRAHTCTQENV